jgi:hypothetical protein
MSVAANVQKNSLNKDGFTEYFIVILYKGSEWGIRKRYSDFVKFDEYLQQSGYAVHYKLPEKVFWSRLDPTLISKRMVELQSYLTSLLQNTLSTDNNLIREFLEVDENVLAQAIKQKKMQPDKETAYADRFDLIVKDTRKSMLSIETIFRGNTNRHNVMSRTRQYSFMHANNQNSSNSTPPASPMQTGNRANSFVGARSLSAERRLGQGAAPASPSPITNHSPVATPHGSFSLPTGLSNVSEKSGSYGANRDSRDNRLSSLNQAASRFLLGSYSGQTALDAALALEDVHRKEAFLAHVSKTSDAHRAAGSGSSRVGHSPKLGAAGALPKPYTQECEVEFHKQVGPHTRRETESESDAEGDMFLDDMNSFLLDILSEPVLNITTACGLAMHEELDVQADDFRGLGPSLRQNMIGLWGSCTVNCDWFVAEDREGVKLDANLEHERNTNEGDAPPPVPIRRRSKSDVPKFAVPPEPVANNGLNQLRRMNSETGEKLPKLKKTSSLDQQ